MSRKYEHKYRKQRLAQGASSDGVARHTVPAQWLGQYDYRDNDHM